MSDAGTWTVIEAATRGLPVRHVARAGRGAPLLLVHGVGPGTTGPANFAPLIEALPRDMPLHMIDLAGFGGSARKPAQPGFDVGHWLAQIDDALERIGAPAVLVGNSVGGALALKAAARRSDILAVLAIGAPAAPMAPTAELAAFWRAPRSPGQLAAALRPMTARAAEPPPAVVAERWRPFEDADHAAWFDAMLERPGDCLASAAVTPEEARAIKIPVRLLHGRQDRACPPAPLCAFVLEALPGADLTLLADCGHNVIAERTAEVVSAIALIRGF
jgi:pimeloyl-ACP methyl ester carboxylesterase